MSGPEWAISFSGRRALCVFDNRQLRFTDRHACKFGGVFDRPAGARRNPKLPKLKLPAHHAAAASVGAVRDALNSSASNASAYRRSDESAFSHRDTAA